MGMTMSQKILAYHAGLDSPFDEGCLRVVCQAAQDWLDGADLSGIR